jgi:hypothetical protein
MLRRSIIAIAAGAVLGIVIATTDSEAGHRKRDRGYVTVPWDSEIPDLGGPPFLLTPGFLPPWVPGCYQIRAIRTQLGWMHQRVWVCS